MYETSLNTLIETVICQAQISDSRTVWARTSCEQM